MMDQFNTFYKPDKENEKRENRWTTPFLEQQTHPSACKKSQTLPVEKLSRAAC